MAPMPSSRTLAAESTAAPSLSLPKLLQRLLGRR